MIYQDDYSPEIKALFLDIGGVLLTNGWAHQSRFKAIEEFCLEKQEVESRHQLLFETYETGKITHDEYLNRVIFYRDRNFSKDDFTAFMLSQSQAIPGSIEFFKTLKQKYQLKIIAVNNEGRELNAYRIKQFNLDELFDAYISSCFVHLHKPDKDLLTLACDISNTPAEHVLYIDDGILLIEIAKSMGFQTLHFQDIDAARQFIQTCSLTEQPVVDQLTAV